MGKVEIKHIGKSMNFIMFIVILEKNNLIPNRNGFKYKYEQGDFNIIRL